MVNRDELEAAVYGVVTIHVDDLFIAGSIKFLNWFKKKFLARFKSGDFQRNSTEFR